MRNVLIVMLGGFIGANLRYWLGEWMSSSNGFPTGTFVINAIGCFLLGWLLTYSEKNRLLSKEWSLLLGTGLIGSFTTFSTFSVETLLLIESAKYIVASLYVFGSIFLGIGLAYIGVRLALYCKKEEDIA